MSLLHLAFQFAIDHEIPKINSFKHTSDPSAVLCRLLDFT